MSTITSLPYTIDGFKITQVTTDETCIEVHAVSTSHIAHCPDCGRPSNHCHGWYQRHPQTVSSVGRQMRLCLRVKRYREQVIRFLEEAGAMAAHEDSH